MRVLCVLEQVEWLMQSPSRLAKIFRTGISVQGAESCKFIGVRKDPRSEDKERPWWARLRVECSSPSVRARTFSVLTVTRGICLVLYMRAVMWCCRWCWGCLRRSPLLGAPKPIPLGVCVILDWFPFLVFTHCLCIPWPTHRHAK